MALKPVGRQADGVGVDEAVGGVADGRRGREERHERIELGSHRAAVLGKCNSTASALGVGVTRRPDGLHRDTP